MSPQTPDQARSDWQRHGIGMSQVSEDKRRAKKGEDTVVKIIASGTRNDVNGAQYTAYLISISMPNSKGEPLIVEHRYSEFAKLHVLLRNEDIELESKFPSKHWAGRVGSWTPSLQLAPSQHEELIAYRKTQLDLWLVDLVELFNQGKLSKKFRDRLQLFLSQQVVNPCDRENERDLSFSTLERGLKWINPLSFTLGSAIRQATSTLQSLCKGRLNDSDQSIPLDLLHQAKALCFLTVFKAGMVVSGKVGTGLVIAKNDVVGWSAPSAIGTLGLGWGPQIGGEFTHYLIVLTSNNALNILCQNASITVGAELGIAAGPLGRNAQSHISHNSMLQPAYAYAHSSGLFAGMSFEGGMLKSRNDVNANFYGKPIAVAEILQARPQPKAAEPLYAALAEAFRQKMPSKGLRPSMFLDQICGPKVSTPILDFGSMTADSFADIESKGQSEAESSVFENLRSPGR